MSNLTQKNNRCRKNGDKDGKAMHKLKNNAVNEKTMKNLRNRIDIRLISNNNKKRLFKMDMKTKRHVTKYI